MGWGGRWEGGSGWGTHVHPWLIHVNIWQKPPQYYKVISLQLKFKTKKFFKDKKNVGGGRRETGKKSISRSMEKKENFLNDPGGLPL